MRGPTTVDLLFLILEKLTTSIAASRAAVLLLAEKAGKAGTPAKMIACAELWVCVFLGVYSVLLIAKGIRWKRLLVVPFILSAVYASLLPCKRFICGQVLAGILAFIFAGKTPAGIKRMLSDGRVFILMLSACATLFVLAFRAYFVYIPLLVLVFRVGNGLLGGLVLSAVLTLLAIAVVSVFSTVLYLAESLILALFFCAAGSFLFLTLLCIATGYPRGFAAFQVSTFDFGSVGYCVSFVLWLALCAVGLVIQLPSPFK